ncbi:RNP domain-containing protein [Apiospora saccharicola]|uniref:RNP domain-containing protein n=1 Tax=Apiospora saccharicola TaxID=335842 RepID=A0ABR1WHE8_9PEZI
MQCPLYLSGSPSLHQAGDKKEGDDIISTLQLGHISDIATDLRVARTPPSLPNTYKQGTSRAKPRISVAWDWALRCLELVVAPPRPPPSKLSGFKPAFSPGTPPTTQHTPSPGVKAGPYAPPAYSSAPSYPGASAPQYGAAPSYSSYAAPPGAGPMSGRGAGGYGPPQTGSYQSYPQVGGYGAQPSYYGAAADTTTSYGAAPQIRNPFPVPQAQPATAAAGGPGGATGGAGDYDPDMAAQIAQWQSAYVPEAKDSAGASGPGGNGVGRSGAVSAAATYAAEPTRPAVEPATAATTQADGKKKTVVRAGGGQKWTDDSLLEWDPSHLRLFVGNLAGETTDESLFKAFSRWQSLQKARVIRDKVTSKSKGFGFVSFSDPDEFFAAAKEMNGKYIQSHPVVIRKSTTEIKPQTVKDKHGGKWNKNKNRNNRNQNQNRGGNGGGAGGRENSFEPSLGPAPTGVTKPGQKTKGGLKLLG